MRIKIPLKIIELEPENVHIVITCSFSDGTNGNWIIDTGASKTVFDKKLIQYYSELDGESDQIHSAGIGEKPMDVRLGELESLTFEKLSVENQKVALLDLSHINILYAKVSNIKIVGLLGSDFLLRHKAIIDYRKKRIVLKQA